MDYLTEWGQEDGDFAPKRVELMTSSLLQPPKHPTHCAHLFHAFHIVV